MRGNMHSIIFDAPYSLWFTPCSAREDAMKNTSTLVHMDKPRASSNLHPSTKLLDGGKQWTCRCFASFGSFSRTMVPTTRRVGSLMHPDLSTHLFVLSKGVAIAGPPTVMATSNVASPRAWTASMRHANTRERPVRCCRRVGASRKAYVMRDVRLRASQDAEEAADREEGEAETPRTREEGVEEADEDLGKKIQAAREARASTMDAEKTGYAQQVLEELQRVEWPGAGAAFTRTLLVISIVGGAGALLLVLNAALAQVSERLFGL